MALLQTYQAKALKQLYEGSSDPGLMQELRTATDLALRATKVTARSLGQTMSTLVVQEWPMAGPGGYGWVRQAPLPGLPDLPGRPLRRRSGELCPAVLHRTEAGGHILPRRPTAVITPPPVAAPPPARRRGRPPAAPTFAPAPAAAFTPAAAWSWQQESGAARLCPCQAHEVPGQAAFLGRANPRHWVLLFRRWWVRSFPRWRSGWKILFSLFGLFRHWLSGQWYPNFQSSFLCLRFPRGRGRQCTGHSLDTSVPLFFRQWAAGSGPRTRCLLPRPLPSHGAR